MTTGSVSLIQRNIIPAVETVQSVRGKDYSSRVDRRGENPSTELSAAAQKAAMWEGAMPKGGLDRPVHSTATVTLMQATAAARAAQPASDSESIKALAVQFGALCDVVQRQGEQISQLLERLEVLDGTGAS